MSEIQNAEIDWLDDGSPISRQFNDIYFSSQGGVAESEHVFINSNNLAQRWQQHSFDTPFFIVELGFGTGLNFLLCWQLLEQLAIDGLHLHYLAFEKHPLTVEDLRKSHVLWPELHNYSTPLIAAAIDHTPGLHRLCLGKQVTLDLYLGDALAGMRELFPSGNANVDCWFMDGFAPARNPELWNDPIAELMWQQSKPGTTVSTYSVAGQVRQSLLKAGFQLERLPGYGNKREMLRARKIKIDRQPLLETSSRVTHRPAWYKVNTTPPDSKVAVVVGAGLAGCSTAYSLARRGWQVTLIDSASEVAAGASGNRQGVLQPRLAAEHSARSQFYIHGLLFAHRQFSQLQQARDIGWHPDGILRIPDTNRSGPLKLLNNPQRFYSHKVLTAVTTKQASDLAGLELGGEALFLPHGGWIRPAELCRAYLECIATPGLQLITQQEITTVRRRSDLWQLIGPGGTIAEAPIAILCNSHAANSLPQTSFLPLLPVRGQLTAAAQNSTSSKLRRVVITEKYICPADDGLHSVGASYQNRVTDTSINADENRENLQGFTGAFGKPEQLVLTAHDARAAVRCNAVDYFPVVGAVPDHQDFIEVFGALKRNAEARIEQPASYHPGLFVNTAHGSYGLASCPLAAEYLASLINNESQPLTNSIADSLSPARFIIRELKKQ